jgi:hypothetical protein
MFASLLAAAVVTCSTGCGNSDSSVTLNREQTAALVKLLGTYVGDAYPKRIMGAMMTGTWTVKFFQDDAGVMQCKCTLQLHDEQYGWGRPESEVVGVKVFKWPENDYTFQASGQKMNWRIYSPEKHVTLTSGQAVDSVSLFDAESNEILLRRR